MNDLKKLRVEDRLLGVMVQGPKSKISEIVLGPGRPTPGNARRPNLRFLGPSVPKL